MRSLFLKKLDEIASKVVKFVVRVRQFWNSRSVNCHVAQMPLEDSYFTNDITIVEERSRSGKFAAAQDVRVQHDDGAILMASNDENINKLKNP